ncbi:alpha/beta fold hydrolase [Dyadobacter sp. NIV53]|uniref:alpha/beta fold hydrolase n=1 Tax=Dyadobacter sp. NIV53 TaxID=2861765 RepID=UPI001E4FA5CB|nr:alpha/beta hydrolase [Dyadobacter sp. NIV53]
MQPGPTLSSQVPYGNNVKAGHYVKSGDARIYYEVYGKGRPVVILHGGIFGSTYEMAQFIDSLSPQYQVIAISNRGHGKSEMGSGLATFEQKAKDIYKVIHAVTSDSVIVLGFSDGAYSGYYLASLYPEKVKKLIAIGAGEWTKGSRTFSLTAKQAFAMDSLYYKQQLALRPDPEKIDLWFSSINTYYNSVSIGKEILSSIHCPVLLIAGDRDQNAPIKTVIAACDMIPKVQLSIIPNAPHTAFLVNFPAVWDGIVPFLKQ